MKATYTPRISSIDGMKLSNVFRAREKVAFSISMSDAKCHAAQRAVDEYDGHVETIEAQQREIDELKAMVNKLRWAAEHLDEADPCEYILATSPEQCLLERDKLVIGRLLECVIHYGIKHESVVCVSDVREYIDQLGGDK